MGCVTRFFRPVSFAAVSCEIASGNRGRTESRGVPKPAAALCRFAWANLRMGESTGLGQCLMAGWRVESDWEPCITPQKRQRAAAVRDASRKEKVFGCSARFGAIGA